MKTPIQKGKIESNPSTLKHMSRAEMNRQDYDARKLRLSGQSPTLHEPKGKK